MYRNSSDKRVQRTGDHLFDALCTLLETRTFTEIGIKEISEAAGIGRATFYRNFDYVKDILVLKVSQAFQTLDGQLLTEKYTDEETVKRFLSFWVKQEKILRVLIKAECWEIFSDEFTKVSSVRINELTTEENLNELQVKYLTRSMNAHISSVLHTWVENDCQEDAETLIQMFRLPHRMLLRAGIIWHEDH